MDYLAIRKEALRLAHKHRDEYLRRGASLCDADAAFRRSFFMNKKRLAVEAYRKSR